MEDSFANLQQLLCDAVDLAQATSLETLPWLTTTVETTDNGLSFGQLLSHVNGVVYDVCTLIDSYVGSESQSSDAADLLSQKLLQMAAVASRSSRRTVKLPTHRQLLALASLRYLSKDAAHGDRPRSRLAVFLNLRLSQWLEVCISRAPQALRLPAVEATVVAAVQTADRAFFTADVTGNGAWGLPHILLVSAFMKKLCATQAEAGVDRPPFPPHTAALHLLDLAAHTFRHILGHSSGAWSMMRPLEAELCLSTGSVTLSAWRSFVVCWLWRAATLQGEALPDASRLLACSEALSVCTDRLQEGLASLVEADGSLATQRFAGVVRSFALDSAERAIRSLDPHSFAASDGTDVSVVARQVAVQLLATALQTSACKAFLSAYVRPANAALVDSMSSSCRSLLVPDILKAWESVHSQQKAPGLALTVASTACAVACSHYLDSLSTKLPGILEDCCLRMTAEGGLGHSNVWGDILSTFPTVVARTVPDAGAQVSSTLQSTLPQRDASGFSAPSSAGIDAGPLRTTGHVAPNHPLPSHVPTVAIGLEDLNESTTSVERDASPARAAHPSAAAASLALAHGQSIAEPAHGRHAGAAVRPRPQVRPLVASTNSGPFADSSLSFSPPAMMISPVLPYLRTPMAHGQRSRIGSSLSLGGALLDLDAAGTGHAQGGDTHHSLMFAPHTVSHKTVPTFVADLSAHLDVPSPPAVHHSRQQAGAPSLAGQRVVKQAPALPSSISALTRVDKFFQDADVTSPSLPAVSARMRRAAPDQQLRLTVMDTTGSSGDSSFEHDGEYRPLSSLSNEGWTSGSGVLTSSTSAGRPKQVHVKAPPSAATPKAQQAAMPNAVLPRSAGLRTPASPAGNMVRPVRPGSKGQAVVRRGRGTARAEGQVEQGRAVSSGRKVMSSASLSRLSEPRRRRVDERSIAAASPVAAPPSKVASQPGGGNGARPAVMAARISGVTASFASPAGPSSFASALHPTVLTSRSSSPPAPPPPPALPSAAAAAAGLVTPTPIRQAPSANALLPIHTTHPKLKKYDAGRGVVMGHNDRGGVGGAAGSHTGIDAAPSTTPGRRIKPSVPSHIVKATRPRTALHQVGSTAGQLG